MKREPRTQIICTLGPSSTERPVLRKMILAGMDVVRLNFSHGSYEHRLHRIRTVRELSKKLRRTVKILGDLEGYRIRIGRLDRPVKLKKNGTVWLAQTKASGSGNKIPFDYEGSLKAIRNGHHVFIEDGRICLRVTGRKKAALKCVVIVAGIVRERKGVNIPEAKLEFSSLTAKDRQDIGFCVANRVDLIAQSFVRNKEDILKVRELLGDSGKSIKVIAKIENRQGIRNIDSIIKVSDGIMIARGDMGISIPIYEVPIIQKRIIRKCNRAGKFVITATQMLESMTEDRLPTRAEVTDVANAVLDGSDYVMLSGETAVGEYPVETVEMMDQIIRFTEKQGGI